MASSHNNRPHVNNKSKESATVSKATINSISALRGIAAGKGMHAQQVKDDIRHEERQHEKNRSINQMAVTDANNRPTACITSQTLLK